MHQAEYSSRALAPGARIQLVAPAGPFDVTAFELGAERLRSRYEVHFHPDLIARDGYLAGDDERRSRELRGALARKNIDAIIAARGGYGSSRILPLLAAEEVRASRAMLVGFSDITALHALWAQAGIASMHGSMVAGIGLAGEAQFKRFCAALEGHFPAHYDGLEAIVHGTAEGILLGGNLTVLTSLIGTPYFPSLAGSVLFLEDVSERPYRVDRMLTTWRNAGAFRGVRGIVLGAFTNCDPGPDLTPLSAVLRDRLSDLGMPIATGLPAGHIPDNVELPFGRRVTLDANAGRLYLHVSKP